MKIAIYTASFGNYDPHIKTLVEGLTIQCPTLYMDYLKDTDFYFITDTEDPITGWKNIRANVIDDGTKLKYARTNRYYKTHPHLFFRTYDINVYVDSSAKLIPFQKLYDVCLQLYKSPYHDFYAIRHPNRQCVKNEAEEVSRQRRDDPEVVMGQYNGYIEEGFPDDMGLTSNGILIRKCNKPRLERLMDVWWKEIRTKSYRDQISLNYAVWKTKYPRYHWLETWYWWKLVQFKSHPKKLFN